MKRKGMNCYAPFNRLSHCISTAILTQKLKNNFAKGFIKFIQMTQIRIDAS